ncbi:MAG: crossover junction endodeoxyribonuclease RuvC [Opitutaceae bacterium]|nr:crossover junction endodeoxyribonuclease RuvC [Opitutaceae bacterium]
MSVRQMWKAKIAGKLMAKSWPETATPHRSAYAGRVLGIDPSLRGTGLALIEFAADRPAVLLHSRTLRISARYSMAHCLGEIFKAATAVIDAYEPRHVALEQTIYVQNIRTAQILGAARGALIAAAAIKGREVFEYPPLRVKQAVVGAGRASKEQMARTIMQLLGHGRTLALDESDAAGVAICHALTWRG